MKYSLFTICALLLTLPFYTEAETSSTTVETRIFLKGGVQETVNTSNVTALGNALVHTKIVINGTVVEETTYNSGNLNNPTQHPDLQTPTKKESGEEKEKTSAQQILEKKLQGLFFEEFLESSDNPNAYVNTYATTHIPPHLNGISLLGYITRCGICEHGARN